jgi:hypothetical protein
MSNLISFLNGNKLMKFKNKRLRVHDIFYYLRLFCIVVSTNLLYIWVTWRGFYKKQELLILREHLSSPTVFGGVRVAHLFSFLCCHIMCLYVLTSVLWCPFWFPYKNDVRFLFASSCVWDGSYLLYVICVMLHMVVSNTYCVVFLFCLSLLCALRC